MHDCGRPQTGAEDGTEALHNEQEPGAGPFLRRRKKPGRASAGPSAPAASCLSSGNNKGPPTHQLGRAFDTERGHTGLRVTEITQH